MSEWSEYMHEYTGRDQWNAVYTITIGELLDAGVFDWSMPELDWSDAAYNPEQYKRVCNYFIERFYYREISIEPFAEWARMLKRKLVYELMPKYKHLYKRVEDGISPLAQTGEYHKRRNVHSDYPQTLLSENSDYLTSGDDLEYETIREGDLTEMLQQFAESYHNVDEMLLDELESMFVCMYTTNVNATW